MVRFVALLMLMFFASSAFATPVTNGLRLWLDAADQSTLYTDSTCSTTVTSVGDSVRCWKGKGPNSFEASNNGANVPKLVQDGEFEVLEFTSDQLGIPGTTGGAVFNSGEIVDETEMFFVARTRNITSGVAFRHNSGGKRFGSHFPWGNSRVYFDVGQCCGNARIQAPWGGSSSFLHTWNFISDDNAPNYQAIYRDNDLVGSDTTADFITWGTDPFYLGGNGNSSYQQINAAEVIIYDRRLTISEREQVKNYLLNKWKKPVEAGDDWIEGFSRGITSPSGTDRLLIVSVGGEHNLGQSIAGVTYGNQALTEIIQEETGTSYGATSSLWYLDDTGIDAANNTDFVVAYNGGAFAHTDIASAVYSNINQDNPIFITESVEDGQSFASSLSGSIETTVGGLTVLSAQSGNDGTFGSSMTVEIIHSGNSTTQLVSAEVEPNAIVKNFTVSHDNPSRMVVVAAHLRQNVLPEVGNLSAQADSDTSISLSWDPEPGVTNYRIVYLEGAVAPQLCSQGTMIDAGFSGNYQLTSLNPLTEYSFRVCASDGIKFTNGLVVTATTDANAPLFPNELLSIVANSSQPNTANFSWVSGGGGTTGFTLAYNVGAIAPANCSSGTQIDLGLTTSYQLTSLSQLEQYSYRVCAYNGTPVYSNGLTGSFTTPAIASSSNVASVIKGWAVGAQRSDLGLGQNRALLVSISREGGSEITGATYGGQAMTLLAERTEGTLSIETYILNETGLVAAIGDTVVASFTGAIPFYVSYSTLVAENVHQSLLATSTGVSSAGFANNLSTTLSVNNGGLSLVAAAHNNQNSTGSMGTAGWVLGSSAAAGSYMVVTGYHPNTVLGNDIAQTNFSQNGALALNGIYLELAIPTETSDFTLASISDVVANLTWTSGHGTTDSYIIAYQPNTAPANCSLGTQVPLGDLDSHALTGLTADTLYGARLCSVNVQGVMSAGQTLTFQTEANPTLPPNEVINLAASVISDSEIALTWDNGGGSTEGFTVAYQLGATAPVDCSSGTTENTGFNTAHPVINLAPNTLYSFRVCSLNANGVFSSGLTVSSLTEEDATNSVTLSGTWETGLTRTANAGTNRALIFVVSSEDDLNADVTAITYGGQDLIFAEQSSFSTAGTFIRTEIWYLLEDKIQLASGTNFDVTWSDGNLERRYYSHVMLDDIDQQSPIYSTAQSGFPANVNPIERSISSLDGGLSIASAVTENNGTYSFNNSWSFGSNQTGNSSTLGTAHFVSGSNGSDVASVNHTAPTGVSAVAAVHFKSSEVLPPEVVNLAVNNLSSSSININWLSGGGTSSGFKLAYQLGATAPVDCNSGTVINTGVNTSRSITGLTHTSLYSMRVCSFNSSGDLSPGQVISATTDTPPTQWTGAVSSDWFNPGNWSVAVPTKNINCIIPNVANDPIINGNVSALAVCKNLDLQAPLLLDGSGIAVELELYGDLLVTAAGVISESNGILSLTEDVATTQIISSTSILPVLNLKKNFSGSVSLNSNIIIGELTSTGTSQTLNIGSRSLSVQQTTSITTGTTVNLSSGSEWLMGNGSTLFLAGGAINAAGSIDTSLQVNPGYGPSQVNFGVIGGAGSWNFESNAGSLSLSGVRMDRLSPAGFRILGNSNVSNYTGVQMTHLPVGVGNTALYLNTTGNFPVSGSYNAFDFDGTPVGGQYTVQAPGQCGSGAHAYTFLEWFGNFAKNIGTASVSDNEPTCDIVMETSTSPVTMAKVFLTPFNKSVKLYWETSAEFMHKGFNVYRQIGADGERILLTESPVVSLGLGMSIRGEYNYTDTNLTNQTEYYYFLQDIPVLGEGSTYGPYKATPVDVPEALARTVEYRGPNTEVSNDQVDELPEEEVIGDQWLAQGVNYRLKPDGSLRIFISPPELQTAASQWNSQYKTTFMQDYLRFDEAGKPALPSLTLNIPIEYEFSGLTETVIRKEEGLLENILPEPAPSWTLNSEDKRLEPSWAVDSSLYNSESGFPGNKYYNIKETSVLIDGKPHLQIKINPVLFFGELQLLKVLQHIVIDIAVNSTQRVPSSNGSIAETKSLGSEPGVRVVVAENGFYKLSYEDLFAQGLESQFNGAFINEFRLLFKDSVIPVFHEDKNEEGFGEGDSLIFKAKVEKTAYGSESHFILTRVDQGGSFYQGDQGVDPANWGGDITFERSEVYEVDSPGQFVNDRSLGEDRDHFYWARMFLQSGDVTSPSYSKFCHPVSVSGAVSSVVDVKVAAAMRSNGSLGSNYSADVYFESAPGNKKTVTYSNILHQEESVSLILPASSGDTENLCIAVAEFNTNVDEYHILDLDKFTITYQAELTPEVVSFTGLASGSQYYLPVDEAKGSFKVFETGPNGQNKNYFAGQIVEGAYEFNTSTGTHPENNFDIVYDSEIKPIASLSYYENEASKINEYVDSDLLIITSSSFKDEFAQFIDHKLQMGLKTAVVELSWIFDNFGYGQASPYYIRNFFRYLNNQSSSKVKYIMFAMDGTYDFSEVSSNSNVNSSPVFLQTSNYSDFASDYWFLKDSSASNGILSFSIGRVPVRTQIDLQNYLQKVIAFETAEQPVENLGIQSILAEDPFVDFQNVSEKLRTQVQSLEYDDEYFSTSDSSASVKSKLNESFSNKLFVNYMGHGSEYMLGESHFELSDIANMTNNDNLPIFLGLNCLTGVYEQEDGADKSFGEALISQSEAGAIAVLSANTLLSPREQEAFASEFYAKLNSAHLYGSRDSSRLGDIYMKSQAGLKNQSLASNETESFALLGDPSLMMPESLIPYRSLSSDGDGDGDGDSGGGCGLVAGSGKPPSSPWPLFIILLLPLILLQKLKWSPDQMA